MKARIAELTGVPIPEENYLKLHLDKATLIATANTTAIIDVLGLDESQEIVIPSFGRQDYGKSVFMVGGVLKDGEYTHTFAIEVFEPFFVRKAISKVLRLNPPMQRVRTSLTKNI